MGSERAYEILTESLQTLGGSGFVVEAYPLEQYIRDAKIDFVYESTNGAKRRKSQCTARRQDGSPRRKYRINGSTICRSHGGTAKQTVNAARIRLQNAAELMAKELLKLATDDSVVASSTAKPI